MYAILQQNLELVSAGTQMIKRDLFQIEQHHTCRDRPCDGNPLEELIGRVIQLELDVTTLMANYMSVCFSYPEGPTSQMLDRLWTAFLILDGMYMDLKRLAKKSNRPYVHPAELKQLQASWVKLNKLTSQAQERLADGKLLSSGGKHSIH